MEFDCFDLFLFFFSTLVIFPWLFSCSICPSFRSSCVFFVSGCFSLFADDVPSVLICASLKQLTSCLWHRHRSFPGDDTERSLKAQFVLPKLGRE